MYVQGNNILTALAHSCYADPIYFYLSKFPSLSLGSHYPGDYPYKATSYIQYNVEQSILHVWHLLFVGFSTNYNKAITVVDYY